MVSPSGPVYQAGTLSGNPLAMNAGYAALSYIQEHPEVYQILEEKSAYLENGIKSVGKNFQINRVGSMMTLFFTEEPVVDYNSAVKSDTALYGKYFHEMLNRGNLSSAGTVRSVICFNCTYHRRSRKDYCG